jgi:serine/threonine-protein kinase
MGSAFSDDSGVVPKPDANSGEVETLPKTPLVSNAADNEAPAEEQAPDPLVGTTLDARYRVLRVIGEGGMGVVYEAQHVLIEKHVALKVLRDTFTSRPDVVERFRQEAKSVSRIGHPNIVDVSDFGETPSGQSYIVMEMLFGEDLADVLSRERVLPPSRAVRIVYQVARALHATHKKEIVHRDLKPENIYLIERDGVTDIVKVVDFGVAKMNDASATSTGRKLTRTGMIFGTPEYMSPEQALGRPFDHRVDIYALGAILFELLTGRVPFTGENFMEILAHHGHTPLPAMSSVNAAINISPALEAVVLRALSKEPGCRYQSMGELAEALRATPEMPALEHGELTGPQPLDPQPSAAAIAAPARTRARSSLAPTPVIGIARARRSAELDNASYGALARSNSLSPAFRFGQHTGSAAHTGDTTPPPLPHMRRRSYASEQHLDDVSLDDAAQEAVLLSTGRFGALPVRPGMALALLGLAVTSMLLAMFVVQRMSGVPSLFAAPGHVPNHLQPTAATPQAAPAAQTTHSAATDPAVVPVPRDPASAMIMGATHAPAVSAGEAEATHVPGNLVEVRVRTRPSGASVTAVGTDAHCAAAPCSLAVPRGRAVTLRAENSIASVERTYTFDDASEIEIRVAPPRKAGKGAAKPDDDVDHAQPAPMHTRDGDLKIPAIFRDR